MKCLSLINTPSLSRKKPILSFLSENIVDFEKIN